MMEVLADWICGQWYSNTMLTGRAILLPLILIFAPMVQCCHVHLFHRNLKGSKVENSAFVKLCVTLEWQKRNSTTCLFFWSAEPIMAVSMPLICIILKASSCIDGLRQNNTSSLMNGYFLVLRA